MPRHPPVAKCIRKKKEITYNNNSGTVGHLVARKGGNAYHTVWSRHTHRWDSGTVGHLVARKGGKAYHMF